MQSCLGIHIQNNLIKYAKVAKERNNLKIEAYGVKFYEDDLEKTIEQIVKETFSYQVPISVNLDHEQYVYSDVFNLLKPQDFEKAVNTEFEFYCNNNNKNKNTLEYRSLKAVNLQDRDKARIIYTFVDKASLVERIQLFDKYKVHTISPISTSIPLLNTSAIQDNSIIINLEETTELTTIVNGQVYKIDKLEKGMKDILENISLKENSFSKAYEVCKNTTVYTKSSQNLKIDGNEYLDEIITILLDIIDQVKNTIITNGIEINNVYITGTGLIINNIDLLFQESFMDKKCEILVPYFVEKTNVKINIKDYLEVNSAIALAMNGLETKKQNNNFSNKGNNLEKLRELLTTNVNFGKKIAKTKEKKSIKEIMHGEIDTGDKILLRTATMLTLVVVIYIAITETLSGDLLNKISTAEKTIEDTNAKIAKVNEYDTLITTRTNEYQKLIDAIDQANSEISENYSSKNAIPNLLTKVMFNIPKGVQLLSVENTSGKNITITAQARKYDQLGYFKAALDELGILTNITTTKGVKPGELISVTITGELPD